MRLYLGAAAGHSFRLGVGCHVGGDQAQPCPLGSPPWVLLLGRGAVVSQGEGPGSASPECWSVGGLGQW